MQRQIKNSRILVTGGAGFIGSNLVEVLLEQSNEVVCLDNFATGKRENLAPFMDRQAFTLVEGDIRDAGTCATACEGADFVLHHAALGSVPRSIHDPVTTDQVNCNGFVTLLTAARDAGVRRVVYATSSSVYGDNPTVPKVEDRTGRPLSPYAVTKLSNELYADVFARTYGMELVGLRYFNVFGRRQDPFGAYAAVIPRFAIELINHRRPVINGDGSFSRDFTYIENVVQANQLAALATHPEAPNTVFNVAFGGRTTLLDLFNALRTALSSHDAAIGGISPVFGEERAGDIPHSLADISKARRILGYDPRFDINTGLQEAAGWYWNNLGARETPKTETPCG